jgi:hypothetical protein
MTYKNHRVIDDKTAAGIEKRKLAIKISNLLGKTNNRLHKENPVMVHGVGNTRHVFTSSSKPKDIKKGWKSASGLPKLQNSDAVVIFNIKAGKEQIVVMQGRHFLFKNQGEVLQVHEDIPNSLRKQLTIIRDQVLPSTNDVGELKGIRKELEKYESLLRISFPAKNKLL